MNKNMKGFHQKEGEKDKTTIPALMRLEMWAFHIAQEFW